MLASLYIKLGVLAVLLLALAGAGWYVHSLRADIKDLTAANLTLKNSVASLTSSIADQNTAIAQMKIDGDAKQATANAALYKANLTIKAATQRANSIYQAKPSVLGPGCDADRSSALNILNGGTK